MKDSAHYAELLRQMKADTDEQLVADLRRFVESFADHDDSCPGYAVYAPDAELTACQCGFARRHDLFDELRIRLARAPGSAVSQAP